MPKARDSKIKRKIAPDTVSSSGTLPKQAKRRAIDRTNDTGSGSIHAGTYGRHFNKTGPIDMLRHYYIDPLNRIDLENVLSLVDNGKYFLFHAPRQTGKTTTLYALKNYLNDRQQYRCLYINVEAAQVARGSVAEALQPIIMDLADTAYHFLKDSFLKDNWEKIYAKSGPLYALKNVLSEWCRQGQKPVVILIDEADALVGDTL